MAAHLWQTTLVLAVLFLMGRVFRRAPASFLNALWWAGLAKLFLPMPLLGALAGRVLRPAMATVSSLGIEVRAVTSWLETTASVLDPGGVVMSSGEGAASPVAVAITLVWLAGAVAFIVLWSRTPTRLTACRAGSPGGGDSTDIGGRLADAVSGTRVPMAAVRVVEGSVVPCVVGLARPRILLPEQMIRELSTVELRSILLHEDAHRRRMEPLRVVVGRAAVLLFFYYPLLWPLLRRLRDTGEMTCDDAVLNGGVAPDTYAGALSRALELGLEPAPSCAALDRRSPSLIRRRLKRLKEPWRCPVMTKHRVMLAAAVALVVLVSVLPLSSFAVDEQKEEEESRIVVARMVPPKYPEDGLKDGVEGTVYLEIELGESLEVIDVRVKEGIPDYPSFDEAAADAAKLWVFTVAPEGAEPPASTVMVPIQFRLDPNKGTVERVKVEGSTEEGDDAEMTEEEAKAKAIAKSLAKSIGKRKIVKPDKGESDAEKDAEKDGEAKPEKDKDGETKTSRL